MSSRSKREYLAEFVQRYRAAYYNYYKPIQKNSFQPAAITGSTLSGNRVDLALSLLRQVRRTFAIRYTG